MSVGGAYWSWRWQLGEGERWRTADGVLTLQMSMKSVRGAYWSWRWQLGEGERWRTADGVPTRPSVNEVTKRRVLELSMASALRDCLGALQMER